MQKKCFFINLHNLLVLYTHAKFVPPTSAADKKLLFDNCTIFTNNKEYHLQDLENEVLEGMNSHFAQIEPTLPNIICVKLGVESDFLLNFCVSDCTMSSPSIFIFTEQNYLETKTLAGRQFLHRTVVLDESNYEVMQICISKSRKKIL